MKGFLCAVFFTVFIMTSAVFAHDTMSEFYPNPNVNEGVVQFFFDNDELMSNIEVTVYNTAGLRIAEGTTCDKGLFDFTALEAVGHIIARYDAEHIQIHVVAEGGAYIVGQNFGGTYVSHTRLGELMRSFVLARYWLTLYALAIPAVIFVISLVFFIVVSKKDRGGVAPAPPQAFKKA
ncbi:MAG: hypothetical protein FWB96_04280 [Defluviitaleaceae bacterium]|nr:hypothetical protein [Defluviitaleaceae bacterium]MCL2262915.1 hypothetical protein [Defluviitaleaceae bacterium]